MSNKEKREAREFCFQYFFHLQLPIFSEEIQSLTDNPEKLKEQLYELRESTNIKLSAKLEKEVEDRIIGTIKNYSQLNQLIESQSKNWKLSRLSKVDYTNLLLASYELTIDKSTPKAVVINESVEIAKKYGAKESARYINGMLDSITQKNES